ncbi:MAG: helix-hairpin-helix domain-containing protein, partial [Phaeodactylibacter sp.]|nr:helix-hairpin-helix domain-containing protein [Phaeodactylibacter sp.]
MNKRLNAFKSFLYFNRFERKGILGLLTLLVLVMWIRLDLVHRLTISYEPVDISMVQALLDSTQQAEPEEITPPESRLFAFDPNTASREQLLELGFPEKLANTMLNYRKKGGQFRKKADLQRIYGMQPELYERIAAYVAIAPPTVLATAKPAAFTDPPVPTAIDPNKA